MPSVLPEVTAPALQCEPSLEGPWGSPGPQGSELRIDHVAVPVRAHLIPDCVCLRASKERL
eukprot:2617439-Alexandrium_andersonii.AAC.1